MELLNNLIKNKAFQNRDAAKQEDTDTLEKSLATSFNNLSRSSLSNVNILNKQIKLHQEIDKREENIANKIGVISAMISHNSLLERLVYNKIEERLPKPEPVAVEPPTVTPPPEDKTPREKQQTRKGFSIPFLPQIKLAEGGMVPGINQTKDKKKDKALPYAETIALPLRASGIAAVTTLGEFIRGTGVLGGFFAPYLKTVVNPFALAMGVSQNIINTLLGGPVQAATLDLEEHQKYFGKTWGKFLNDEEFVAKFIDRESIIGGADDGQQFGEDFSGSENAQKAFNYLRSKGLTPEQAAGIVGNLIQESGVNPNATNPKSKNTGIAQWDPVDRWGNFVNGKTYNGIEWKGVGQSGARSLENQLRFLWWEMESGAGGMSLQSIKSARTLEEATEIFLVKYERPGAHEAVLPKRISNAKGVLKSYHKASRGISVGNNLNPLTPYLVSGPDSGYDTTIQGYPVELHGTEVVVPSLNGFQVYPISNRRYDIYEDPIGVAKRWKEIAHGSNSKMTSFSSGGSAEFWKIAALASKEDSLHPQGQADIAQALYNRASIGIYPGGKSISKIITAPGQFEPTFNNAGAWAAIRDRRSAIAAAGNAQKVDMAAKSITNPSLQREAQRFVGGRTDFMGESQKPHMKPGDVTRGPGYNFHGWFYNAKLPKPAPIPKMVSAMSSSVASPDKKTPKVVVNSVQSPGQQMIQSVQKAITYIPSMIFNPRRVKRELNMKRVR